MAAHTSFKIGGPADRFLRVADAAALSAALRALREAAVPYFVLGNGSNLLVPDEGLRGAVLALELGAAAQVLMMIPLNLIFTVHFNGAPHDVVVAMLPTVIIPFNAIKAGGNALLTFLLYKSAGRLLRLF